MAISNFQNKFNKEISPKVYAKFLESTGKYINTDFQLKKKKRIYIFHMYMYDAVGVTSDFAQYLTGLKEPESIALIFI